MPLDDGIGDTGIRPALIGEIGTNHPPTDNEWRVLRAAGRAGVETGAAVNVHLSWRGADGVEVLEALVAAGMPAERVILSHMDERLDRGYEAFAECRAHISRAPSSYLKQFYFDTVNFDTNCIELAIKFAGADHILAGSDYPHQIGSIPKMLDAVSRLPVSPAEREGIAGRNAANLLGA